MSPDPLLLISLVCAILAAVRSIWADAQLGAAEEQLAEAQRMYADEVRRSDAAAMENKRLQAAVTSLQRDLAEEQKAKWAAQHQTGQFSLINADLLRRLDEQEDVICGLLGGKVVEGGEGVAEALTDEPGESVDSGEPPWLVVMQAMGPKAASKIAVQSMHLGNN